MEIISNSYLSLSATSVDDLASAMQYCSNSSRLVGVDLDRLIGYLGTIEEVTQSSGESVGNMWKTVTARYSNVKLGKVDDDGMGINDVEKALARVNVAIRDSKGSFREMQDVLDDVAKGWKGYDEVTKSSIVTALAGTRQREYMLTLLENYDRALELSGESADSAGLAQDRYNIYLESTEAKLNRLKTSMQELYTSLLDSGFINMFIDGTTGVLNFISALGGMPNLLMTISGIMLIVKRDIITIMALNIGKKIISLGETLVLATSYLGNAVKSMGSAIAMGGSFSDVLKIGKASLMGVVSASNLVVAGIGALVTVIGLFAMAQANAKKKTEDLANSMKEIANANKQQNDSNMQLLDNYEKLLKQYETDKSVKSELLKTQKEVIESFKLEVGASDDVTTSILSQADAYVYLKKAKEKSIEDLKEQLNSEKNSLEMQQGLISDAYKDNEFRIEFVPYLKMDIADDGIANGIKELEDKINQLTSVEFEKIKNDLSVTGFNEYINIEVNPQNIEKVKSDLIELQTLFSSSSKYADSGMFSLIGDKLKDIDAFATKYAEQAKNVQDTILTLSERESGITDWATVTLEQLDTFNKKVEEYSDGNQDYTDYIYGIRDSYLSLNDSAEKISETIITPIESLKTALKSINTDSLSSDNAKLLSDALKTLEDGGKLTYEQFSKLVDLFPNLSAIFGECGDSATDFGGALEYVQGMVDDYGSDLDNLNGTIEKLKDGQILEGKVITDLLNKYPQLRSELIEVNGVRTFEISTLENLASSMEKGTRQSITNEINKTQTVIKQTRARIEAYIQEQIAYSKLSGFNYDEEEDDGLQGLYKTQGEYLELERSLQEQLANIDIISQKGSSSASSSKESKSLKDKYDKLIDQILSSTDEVERALEVSKQKIEMAELLGNTTTQKKEEENINALYDKRKKLITEQADKLRALLKTTKDEEIRATIGQNIVDLQNDYHETQISLIEDRITLVKELHDATIEGLNDEIDLLNQQRTLMNEDSDEYKGTYAKEYQIVLNQQLATIKAISDLKAKGVSEESEEIKSLKSEWKGYESTRLGIIKSVAEVNKQSQLDSLEKGNESLQSLLDMTMDMVKQRYDDEKEMIQDLIDERDKAVKKEIDGYKAIIDAKKKMLKDEQDDRKYGQDLAERQQSIADKENRLEALSKDDTDKAKAEYKKLYEELKKERQDLDNVQYDHSIETQEGLLDEEMQRYEDARNEELEIFKAQKEAEIKEIEDYTSRESNIREEAMKLIQGKSKKFYDELMDYNSKYGNGVIETVVNAWNNGYTAMDKYNGGLYNVLDTMKKISTEMESINEAPLSKFVDDKVYNTSTSTSANSDMSVVSKMMQNSSKWSSASQEDKLKLADENKKLGESIGAYYDSATGTWYTDKTKKKKLYNIGTYHSGGFVGGLKSNEEFAKLLKGEFVVTDKMQNNFMKNVIPKIMGANSTPSLTLNVDRFIDVDKLDNGVDLEKLSTQLVDNVFNKITGAYKLKFGR